MVFVFVCLFLCFLLDHLTVCPRLASNSVSLVHPPGGWIVYVSSISGYVHSNEEGDQTEFPYSMVVKKHHDQGSF